MNIERPRRSHYKPKHPTSQMSSRPMSRRLAYKIYNYTGRIDTVEARVQLFIQQHKLPNMFANNAELLVILKAAGLSNSEQKLFFSCRIYTFDQMARSIIKVERDLFSDKRDVDRWRRYKYPQRRRCSEWMTDQGRKAMADLNEIMEFLNTLDDQRMEEDVAAGTEDAGTDGTEAGPSGGSAEPGTGDDAPVLEGADVPTPG